MKANEKNKFTMIIPATKNNANIAINTINEFLNVNCINNPDIITASTEAINNVVDHAYAGNNYTYDDMVIDVKLTDKLTITVQDKGVGIANVDLARSTLYTTGNKDYHSGMGFTIMEQFSDKLDIKSKYGFGTKIVLTYLNI